MIVSKQSSESSPAALLPSRSSTVPSSSDRTSVAALSAIEKIQETSSQDFSSSFAADWESIDLSLKKGSLEVTFNPDGEIDLNDLLAQKEQEKPSPEEGEKKSGHENEDSKQAKEVANSAVSTSHQSVPEEVKGDLRERTDLIDRNATLPAPSAAEAQPLPAIEVFPNPEDLSFQMELIKELDKNKKILKVYKILPQFLDEAIAKKSTSVFYLRNPSLHSSITLDRFCKAVAIRQIQNGIEPFAIPRSHFTEEERKCLPKKTRIEWKNRLP